MGIAVALLASASAPPCIEESCVRVGPNTKKPADITSTTPSLVMTAIASAIPALKEEKERTYATATKISKPNTVRAAHARSWK
jgi:hypothetical protein